MNLVVTTDGSITVPIDEIVGSFRTFGRLGPVYEVISLSEPASGADVMLTIRVVESGETLDYPLADAMSDPLAL